MILDARLLSIKGLTDVSLLCLTGRQLIPFRFVRYETARADRIAGQADLHIRDGGFICMSTSICPHRPPHDGSAVPAVIREPVAALSMQRCRCCRQRTDGDIRKPCSEPFYNGRVEYAFDVT